MGHATGLLALAVRAALAVIPVRTKTANPAPGADLATLTVVTPESAKVGWVAVVVAHHQDGGSPLAGVGLQFTVDGASRRSATDASGAAELQVRDLRAGRHSVSVAFDGRVGSNRSYQPVIAYGEFDVAPLALRIQTVPAVAGVSFTITGDDYSQTLTSGDTGEVAFVIPAAGLARLSASMPPAAEKSKVLFSRWSDDAFLPDRQIRLQDDVSIDCGVRITYLTEIVFVGLDGHAVDPGRVGEVVLSGPNAEVIKLEAPYPPVWLTTPLPNRRSGQSGLHITPTPYSVASGLYDGLSVINRGEQRFTPTTGATWTIQLLLYDLRIRARDAVFGTYYANHTVVVIDPLGRKRQLVLDANSQATMTAGRGMYLVHVVASGISPAAPVALSRSQTATIPIISPRDIVLFFGSGLAAMILMFIAARRRRWIWRGIAGSARRLAGTRLGRRTASGIPGWGSSRTRSTLGDALAPAIAANVVPPAGARLLAMPPFLDRPRRLPRLGDRSLQFERPPPAGLADQLVHMGPGSGAMVPAIADIIGSPAMSSPGRWSIQQLVYEVRILAHGALVGNYRSDHPLLVTGPLGGRQLVTDGPGQVTMTAGRSVYLVRLSAPDMLAAATVTRDRAPSASDPLRPSRHPMLAIGYAGAAAVRRLVAALRTRRP